MRCAVLIPVLGRPERVVAAYETVRRTELPTGRDVVLPVFLVSPTDRQEIAAVEAANVPHEIVAWKPDRGDYARKMNFGIRLAADEGMDYVFLGADDLRFKADWLTVALAEQAKTDACVIGTNDLGNSLVKAGKHSTHSLVDLDYVKCGSVDGDDLLHTGYHHNFVDTEFIATAKFRGTFAMALHSHVEHLHPDWGKGAMDATYRKGKARFNDDRILFHSRSPMWGAKTR